MMFPSQQEAVFLFLFPNPHRCWPSQQLPSPQWSPELRTAVWILHPVQERPVPNSLHPLTHSLSPNTAFSPRLSPPSPHSHFPCELSSNFHLSPMLTDTGCAYGARMGKEQTFLSAFAGPQKWPHCVTPSSLFQITKLKIDSNPFAKGFRDSSRLTDMER